MWLKDPKNRIILILAGLSLALALLLFNHEPARKPQRQPVQEENTGSVVWTCSMHPEVRRDKPGLCPLCGMSLTKKPKEEDTRPWELRLDETARADANINTSVVEPMDMPHELRLVGKVVYDEQRISEISARVTGRIDRLFVDYTGMKVKKGDHLVELYSPELATAQEELRQAQATVRDGASSLLRAATVRVEASRKKLELLGLSASQIDTIAADQNHSENLVLESPVSGVVVTKHFNEGAYVPLGMPIYTIADLSRVWVVLQAYESDLVWLRFGQTVNIELEAYPGETFQSRIVFIDPTVNPETRTVMVRLNLPNPKGTLKPDMFVRAVVNARLSSSGKAVDASLAGKWISPMHPEIVKDGPGKCDVCGMALVRAESLGLVAPETKRQPLVIPTSAALITGERAVVYVETPEHSFEGREIVLGPQTGDFYIVKSGLVQGERVVTSGAFKIDSELQIRAKHNMLYRPVDKDKKQGMQSLETASTTAAAEGKKPDALPSNFLKALDPLLNEYMQLQDHLSKDNLGGAQASASSMAKALKEANWPGLPAKPQAQWDRQHSALKAAIKQMTGAKALPELRRAFALTSVVLIEISRQLPAESEDALYHFTCPMAFGMESADWLQKEDKIANPYLGQSMPRCGTLISRSGGHKHE